MAQKTTARAKCAIEHDESACADTGLGQGFVFRAQKPQDEEYNNTFEESFIKLARVARLAIGGCVKDKAPRHIGDASIKLLVHEIAKKAHR